jgi:acyl-CoA thioesterase
LENRGKGLGESQRHAQNCPYGVWQPHTEDEKAALASQIYDRNAGRVRKIVNAKQDVVEKRGTIEEQHLMDQKSRKGLGSQSKVIPVYKRR